MPFGRCTIYATKESSYLLFCDNFFLSLLYFFIFALLIHKIFPLPFVKHFTTTISSSTDVALYAKLIVTKLLKDVFCLLLFPSTFDWKALKFRRSFIKRSSYQCSFSSLKLLPTPTSLNSQFSYPVDRHSCPDISLLIFSN